MKNTFFGIAIIIAIAIAYTQMPPEWRRHKDIEHGNALMQKVETYRQQNHRLPENHETELLAQLGFIKNKQGWQPAYQKQSADRYRIIYQDGYAAPYLYRQSDQTEWSFTQQ